MSGDESRVWTQVLKPWIDSFRFPPSQNDVADALKIKRSTMTNWKYGRTKLTPGDLETIVKVTGFPKDMVLRAILLDQGYPIEELNHGTAIEDPPARRLGRRGQ